MAYADRYLADDEELLYETRQHWTTLVSEFVQLVVIAAVAAVLTLIIGDLGSPVAWVVLGLAGIAIIWRWLIPMLQWRSTVYFLTTKRLHKRTGFLTKQGRSIPLSRVNDVSFSASLWERIMRYGTLHVQSASEQGKMTFKHVPSPEEFKNRVYEALDRVND
ncbi:MULTISPECIES: PH domain-containing protein [Streptomyces]|uniref:PH domain-containing protein n=2 Tax=Streptomyces TaxID=1883 RepID=A0A1I6SN73_9ACTN|nr:MULTISPECIES: PH domain-containing protein [Streptomyces]MCK1814442.1 PH domain-containing protein [Streptomyces sp. XM4011]QKV69987.1 PH domain-containing protein [Streptomyces harbinensis]SFS78417.1 PH domain-containing protein [Streptomyces harbinensis]